MNRKITILNQPLFSFIHFHGSCIHFSSFSPGLLTPFYEYFSCFDSCYLYIVFGYFYDFSRSYLTEMAFFEPTSENLNSKSLLFYFFSFCPFLAWGNFSGFYAFFDESNEDWLFFPLSCRLSLLLSKISFLLSFVCLIECATCDSLLLMSGRTKSPSCVISISFGRDLVYFCFRSITDDVLRKVS